MTTPAPVILCPSRHESPTCRDARAILPVGTLVRLETCGPCVDRWLSVARGQFVQAWEGFTNA